MILLFLGSVGSGKDTQADLLADSNDFEVVSSGQAFRDEIAAGTELGKRVEKMYKEGHLMSDEDVAKVLTNALSKALVSTENIVLTGVVRRSSQVKMIDDVLKSLGRRVNGVIFFELSDEEAVKRISGRRYAPKSGRIYHILFNPPKVEGICDISGEKLEQRVEDTEAVTRTRLEEFNRDNDPIIAEYTKRGILQRVDATPGIMAIHDKVISVINLFRS